MLICCLLIVTELEIKPSLNSKLIPPHAVQSAGIPPTGSASSGDGPDSASVIMSPALADHNSDN